MSIVEFPRAPTMQWAEYNQRWLVNAFAALRARMERAATPTASRENPTDGMETGNTDFVPALVYCARTFGLSGFERDLLLLVCGAEIDRELAGSIQRLNGGSALPTFGFALAALADPHWDALSPNAPLRAWRLIEPEAGASLANAPLHVDERILHFVTAVRARDTRLAGFAKYFDAPALAIGSPDGARVADSLANSHVRVVALHNTPSEFAAQRDAVFAAAAQLGRATLWITAADLPLDPIERSELAIHIDREALLTGAIPVVVIDGAEREAAAASLVAQLRSSAVWLGSPADRVTQQPQERRVVRIELQPIAEPGADATMHAALSQFRLNRIARIEIDERLRDVGADARPDLAWETARELSRGGLDALAQRIVTNVTFDDVVLPAPQVTALRDIARHLRHRERVYREWGFGDRHTRGQGLTALFTGESGTGKTLAAEAIANEVRLDLYRVDLATVVSKYIGETEKNLKRLFDAAEASGAVLLFDEADALFGKRSEVKDSHDRYANIEVAYLLQRVEAYRGLAILTTNMKAALDRAFLRRIRFLIHFPFPDAAAREQIWRRQFPERAPVGDIDFPALASLNLSGGHINSIAIAAAFSAADRVECIGQEVIIEAARAEFAKLERSFNAPRAAQ